MHVRPGTRPTEPDGLAAITISTLRSRAMATATAGHPAHRRPEPTARRRQGARSCSTARPSPHRAARRLGGGVRPGGRGRATGSAALPAVRERARRGRAARGARGGAATRCATAGTTARRSCSPSTSRTSTKRSSSWLRDRPGRADRGPADRRPAPAGVRALRRPTRCSPPQSLVTGGVRALHELFDVVEHDVVEAGRMAHRGRRPTRSSTSTRRPTPQRLGIDLPGLA